VERSIGICHEKRDMDDSRQNIKINKSLRARKAQLGLEEWLK
jgi:hypothetical protein